MKSSTFLDKLSSTLLQLSDDELSTATIVLPNKRAKVFLLESLKNQLSGTTFAPNIISIEDFIQEMASLRTVDAIELLFEFYDVYQSLTAKEQQQNFEKFSGKTFFWIFLKKKDWFVTLKGFERGKILLTFH